MKLHALALAAVASSVVFSASRADAQDNAGTAPPPPTTTTTPPPPPPPAATTVAPAAPTETKAQMENGFAFETHMYSQVVSFGAGLGTTLNLPLVTGGIFAGFKLDRLVIGLSYNFTSFDAGGAQIAMTWVPGIRYVFVRTTDERVELFGQLDIGIGHNFGNSESNEIIPADVGIGVRYWVHRQFAISTAGGWNGNWVLTQNPSTSEVSQGIFAGLQVMGVF